MPLSSVISVVCVFVEAWLRLFECTGRRYLSKSRIKRRNNAKIKCQGKFQVQKSKTIDCDEWGIFVHFLIAALLFRWLQSVNSLLHQLDDTVENVAENVAEERAGIGQGKNAVDSILTKRGLSSNIDDDEDDGVDPMLDIQSPDKAVTTEMKAEQHPFIEESWDDVDDVDFEQVITSELLPEPPLLPVETQVEAVAETTSEKVDSVEVIEPSDQRAQTEDEKLNQTDEQKVNQTDDVKPLEEPELVVNAGQIKNEPEAQKEATPADNQLERNDAVDPKEADSEPQSQPSSGTDQPQTSKAEDVSPRLTKMILPPTSRLRIAASNQGSPARNKRPPPQPKPVKTFEKEYKECVQHMKEAQREARQLRRHVVSLNSELETAESEIGPLKQELERAGQRLDKDRKRHKEEMDTVKTRYADELAVLRKQHELTLKEMQARNSGQLEDMRKQLREAEEKRTQEGGDWTKEFQQTVQKEQELHRKISLLE